MRPLALLVVTGLAAAAIAVPLDASAAGNGRAAKRHCVKRARRGHCLKTRGRRDKGPKPNGGAPKLIITGTGAKAGTISSDPAGITCGYGPAISGTCTATFSTGTVVTI